MLCPYCGVKFSAGQDWEEMCCLIPKVSYREAYSVISTFCPDCNEYIVKLQTGVAETGDGVYFYLLETSINSEILLYPKFPVSKQINHYVPEKYRELYFEASQVNSISPRASATLSRYLLQMLLHEELKIKKRNLEEEINDLESQSNIPSTLVAMLQVMRRIANFGAHPKKSTNSGEIIEIEQGEADVMLSLIEEMFDFVFVKPKQQEEFLKDISEKYGIDTK